MTVQRSLVKRLTAIWERSSATDRRPVIFLLVLPVVVFVLPAVFGHPAVAGDNQIQNYPLRVLSGQMLRAGHLPLWDPWIWSGTPLLGGLNAGALYPGTWLYAFLPGLVAWTANLVFVYWAAATGVYVLARMYGLCSLAAVIGAASFGFAGSMTAQIVHLGVVQGASWIPWMVAGELRLAQIFLPGAATPATTGGAAAAPASRDAMPWVLLTGCCGGLVLLAGEPRSMADAAWIGALCAVWWVTRRVRSDGSARTRRIAFLSAIACACVLALAVGGAQLLPGIRFLQTSERSTASLWYFGSGSLQPRWSVLLLVPDILGGDGILHQPRFFAGYNLPEVTGYVGLMACVAAFTLVARSIGRKRHPLSRSWSVWIAVFVAGMVLSFGTYTPLGGPLSHIPFYGAMRLQSRNLTIVDFGLAVLLAFWVDVRLRERSAHGDRKARRRTPWYDVVGLVPAFVSGGLCVALVVAPTQLETALGLTGSQSSSARGLWPWALLQLVVVLATTLFVLRTPRIRATSVRRWLVVVVGGDLFLFSIACSTGFVAGGGVPLFPVALDASSLGTGRFAIYDPLVENLPGLVKVGEPDLNALTHHASVQGYGSAVDASYNNATGTHLDGTLSACALESGSFAPLGLRTLLAIPGSVAPPAAEGLPPAVGSAGCGIDWPARDATSRSWLFETSEEIDRADLSIPSGPSGGSFVSGGLQVGILDMGGAVDWPAVKTRSETSGRLIVRFSEAVKATGLVASGPGAGEIADTSTVGGPRALVALDGPLQDALDREGWHYAGRVAGFARYNLDVPAPTVWVEGGGAGASVSRQSTTIDGGETDSVVADRPVVVERSEAFAPGWHVRLLNTSNGKTEVLPVHRVGVVQTVSLPAGRLRIVWSYWPPGLSLGLVSSAVGVALVMAGVVFFVASRRREGRSRASERPRVG